MNTASTSAESRYIAANPACWPTCAGSVDLSMQNSKQRSRLGDSRATYRPVQIGSAGCG